MTSSTRLPPRRGRWAAACSPACRLLATSPFLLALGLQVVFYSVTTTFLYLLQVKLVDAKAMERGRARRRFADIELVGAALHARCSSALVTARLISRLGLVVALAVTPVLTALGFLGAGGAALGVAAHRRALAARRLERY